MKTAFFIFNVSRACVGETPAITGKKYLDATGFILKYTAYRSAGRQVCRRAKTAFCIHIVHIQKSQTAGNSLSPLYWRRPPPAHNDHTVYAPQYIAAALWQFPAGETQSPPPQTQYNQCAPVAPGSNDVHPKAAAHIAGPAANPASQPSPGDPPPSRRLVHHCRLRYRQFRRFVKAAPL